MIKRIVSVVLLGSVLFAKVTNTPATIDFVENRKIKIIDIRTKGEWLQMGTVKDAYLITFFDEQYGYNPKKFLDDLDDVVKKDEQFAIICNSGSRTKLISNFLGNKHKYKVVNLTGGMLNLLKEGYKPEVYNRSTTQLSKQKIVSASELLKKESEPLPEIKENNSSK